jgi:hypothetical protein
LKGAIAMAKYEAPQHSLGEGDWFIHAPARGLLQLGVLRLHGDTDKPSFYKIAEIEDNEQEEYNAALLCAAPQLLATLQDAMAWFSKLQDWSGVGDPDLQRYSAALKAATTPYKPGSRMDDGRDW